MSTLRGSQVRKRAASSGSISRAVTRSARPASTCVAGPKPGPTSSTSSPRSTPSSAGGTSSSRTCAFHCSRLQYQLWRRFTSRRLPSARERLRELRRLAEGRLGRARLVVEAEPLEVARRDKLEHVVVLGPLRGVAPARARDRYDVLGA